MIVKCAVSRDDDVRVLESIADERGVDAATRARIAAEIRNIRSGERTEADVAYELGFALAQDANWMVIHDLRIEVDGLVALKKALRLVRSFFKAPDVAYITD